MSIKFYADITPAEVARAFNEQFVAALDKPELKKVSKPCDVLIAGWVITPNREYYELVVEGGFGTLHIPPNKQRPDVAMKLGAMPLSGQESFNGFHAKVPFSDEIKISIKLPTKTVYWKHLKTASYDLSGVTSLVELLANGNKAETYATSYTQEYASDSALQAHREIKIIRSGSFDSTNLPNAEKENLISFTKYLSAPSFLGELLKKAHSGKTHIPSPFSSQTASLIGSIYSRINFLIFESEGERFYIGQYLHTADFVYVPSRKCVFVLDNAIYDHAHVHALIDYATKNPYKFSSSLKSCISFKAVAINGVSPYHFFYDSITALYAAQQIFDFSLLERIYALNGRCYADLQIICGGKGDFTTVSDSELSTMPWGVGCDALCIAGLSYKSLPANQIASMDAVLVAAAKKEISLVNRYKAMDSNDLVIWIGISQQKRAWLNQKEVLIDVISRIHSRNNKVCIVFDGMTADIFGRADEKSFTDDALVVSEIMKNLPVGIKTYNLVGCGSLEKIHAASKAHFFISNYSTGSMYPARFFNLPGVAHLSNSMLEAVKDIHLHSDTHLVPAEYVIDVPDENCSRIDFVSYTIDKNVFGNLVETKLIEKNLI